MRKAILNIQHSCFFPFFQTDFVVEESVSEYKGHIICCSQRGLIDSSPGQCLAVCPPAFIIRPFLPFLKEAKGELPNKPHCAKSWAVFKKHVKLPHKGITRQTTFHNSCSGDRKCPRALAEQCMQREEHACRESKWQILLEVSKSAAWREPAPMEQKLFVEEITLHPENYFWVH